MGSGCSIIPMRNSDGVRLSADQSNITNTPKNIRVRLYNHSNSCMLAKPTMVPKTVRTTCRLLDLAAHVEKDVEATTVSDLPLKTRKPSPTRVAFIKKDLVEKGFPQEVAERAARPQRKSSLCLNQSHFKTFSNWCLKRDMDMESVSIQLVAEYFLHMFNTIKRQVATINSHRTALSVVLGQFDGSTVGAHPVISNLIFFLNG